MPSERDIDNYINEIEEKNQIYMEEELEYAKKCHNLEEQLGCPLDVLAKILLYPKIRTRFGIREIDKIGYYVEDDNRGLMIYFKNGTFDKLSNYKKTWWLSESKEE